MKKKFLNKGSIISRGKRSLLFVWGLLSLVSSTAWASADLDRQFQLETIGILRSWDNVDGLFGDYVAAAYKEYFEHQSRFLVNDLSKADSVLMSSKIPYNKVIDDVEILGQLSRSTKTETIIRTRIIKEGHKYFFTLDWLHSPLMELMATTSFTLEEPTDGTPFGTDFISEALQENLTKLIAQVPIYGNVTGRDNNSITLNLGYNSDLKKGDTLVIGTLDEVKKHPLLRTIVSWRLTPVGKIVIEQTDEAMAFGKIIEEEPGREISRSHKIIQIMKAPLAQAAQVITEQDEIVKKREETPKLGWVGGTLLTGPYTWNYSSVTPAVNNAGGGFAFGGKGEGEVWLTREWFVDVEYGYGFWSFSQKDVPSGTASTASAGGGVSGALSMFKFSAGYSYLVTGDFFGPKGWLKLGYKANSFSLPVSTTENTGPSSFGSIFMGLGGDLPIRSNWGAVANFNFRLLSFISQTWITDSMSGSSDIELAIGGYYRLTPRMTVRCNLEVIAVGADFALGANLSQKTITFSPALLYYF